MVLELSSKLKSSKGAQELLSRAGDAAIFQTDIAKLERRRITREIICEVTLHLASAIVAAIPLIITKLLVAESISIGIMASATILALFSLLQIISPFGVLWQTKPLMTTKQPLLVKQPSAIAKPPSARERQVYREKKDDSNSLGSASGLMGIIFLAISILIFIYVTEVAIAALLLTIIAFAQLVYSIIFSTYKNFFPSRKELLGVAEKQGIEDWKKYTYDNATTPGEYLYEQIFVHALIPKSIQTIYRNALLPTTYNAFLIPDDLIQDIASYMTYALGYMQEDEQELMISKFREIVKCECDKGIENFIQELKGAVSEEEWQFLNNSSAGKDVLAATISYAKGESDGEKLSNTLGGFIKKIGNTPGKETSNACQAFTDYTRALNKSISRGKLNEISSKIKELLAEAMDEMHKGSKATGVQYKSLSTWLCGITSNDLTIQSDEDVIRVILKNSLLPKKDSPFSITKAEPIVEKSSRTK